MLEFGTIIASCSNDISIISQQNIFLNQNVMLQTIFTFYTLEKFSNVPTILSGVWSCPSKTNALFATVCNNIRNIDPLITFQSQHGSQLSGQQLGNVV